MVRDAVANAVYRVHHPPVRARKRETRRGSRSKSSSCCAADPFTPAFRAVFPSATHTYGSHAFEISDRFLLLQRKLPLLLPPEEENLAPWGEQKIGGKSRGGTLGRAVTPQCSMYSRSNGTLFHHLFVHDPPRESSS
eukprot:1265626-Rhodomonas_salina.1